MDNITNQEKILDTEYNLELLKKEGEKLTKKLNICQLELQQLKYLRSINKDKQSICNAELYSLKNLHHFQKG